MAEAHTYYWISTKPHRRCQPGLYATEVIVWGQAFAPTPAELVAFADKLQPIAAGPPPLPVPGKSSPIPGGMLLKSWG